MTRSDAFGSFFAKTAAMRGTSDTCSASEHARVNRRRLRPGSKSAWLSTMRAIAATASASGDASASARGVGTSRRPLRTNSGSSNVARSRARALLTAEGVTWSRAAARVTLRSSSTACRTSSRFQSMADRFTIRE